MMPTYYETHKIQRDQYSLERKNSLLGKGICIDCGKNKINFERSKIRCQSCLDKRLQDSKDSYPDKKKQIQKYQKIWIKNNHEHCLQKKKELYQKHKEQYLHDRKIARYKRRSAEGSHTLKEWKNVLEYFGNRCLWCETTDNLERDHVVPISKGGTNYIHNIQPLCKTCNRKKWNKIIDFRPFGNIITDWT